MKLKVQKQIIESILIHLQPFLEKKDASQITSHIFFDVQNDICIVKATDSEIGLQITSHVTNMKRSPLAANGMIQPFD